MRARAALIQTPWRAVPRDRARSAAAKRFLDLVGASVGLVLLALPMLLLALAIRLDSPGPALFRQARTGCGGRPFVIWKFRTMRHAGRDPGSPTVVTRLGAFLRPRGLDELPQLVNVLAGDMSLVGPRPHAIEEDACLADLLPRYRDRQRALPGISGWAQVQGWRGPAPEPEAMAERLRHDLWYVEHRTLALDLHIIGRSLALVVRGRMRG
ncbi:sugar transferase [Segnochrobactrum spirostomi]|uniref:Exopolysaccharide biosynthesis protein n=1 Tax=Segnochrobactrum spirostomi TaxID=2608987 RepID=A0A6A7YB98_9HYPH|nr:sugar transferase [Segnochrobactrum spirostomi]MQT15258.1 exopolysaccharide biosynthesis protein [Segnochrobactrum spirostomi]MQT15642.1 exopolysaccharide biosynthesis protein [Segnochrobactrum spirostomi]